jgi:hypothetical protein
LKFNVIIPTRGREKYLDHCITNLIIAASGKDVSIYIISDENYYVLSKNQDKLYGEGIRVFSYKVQKKYEQFNKSYLINAGLSRMRKDFNYVSIVDADMMYNPNFFDAIIDICKKDVYFISGGYKLNQAAKYWVFEDNWRYTDIPKSSGSYTRTTEYENDNQLYPSQITLSYNLYNKLLSILQTKSLYHEGFIGWGGEDSYLSFFSRECEKRGIIKKIYLSHIWYHLWHPPAKESKEFDKGQHDKNVNLLYHLNEINRTKIEEYLSIHDK